MKTDFKYYSFIQLKMIIPILTLVLSLLTGCTPSEPPINQNTLKLTLIDVSVAEAYLNIKADQVRSNEDIILLRDGKEVLSFKNTQKDTIVTDTALTENTTYKYTVIGRLNGKQSGRSEEVTAVTLLPTSHNITWKTYYFGDNDYTSGNDLYDAAIINENDIWAVGEVYINDSLGNIDTQPYGAIHWDGNKWTPMKVPVRDINIPPSPNAIFSITQVGNTVYVADYANLLKYENNQWKEVAFFAKSIPFNGQVQHIWGTEETNVYCAGWYGSVYHVTGNSWKQIDAGTKTDILDIYGFTNPITNDEIVYFPVSSIHPYSEGNNDRRIIRIINNKTIDSIKWNQDSYIKSLWTNNGNPLYTSGISIYSNKTGKWQKEKGIPNYVINSIRGTNLNDIFAAGNYGRVLHFNGLDWHVYNELYITDGVYSAIRIKNNTICSVGFNGGKAIISIGRR